METYMHKGKHKGKCKFCGKMHSGKCPLDKYQKHKYHEGKFYSTKEYNFGIYKMDPSVDVMTKTKTSF